MDRGTMRAILRSTRATMIGVAIMAVVASACGQTSDTGTPSGTELAGSADTTPDVVKTPSGSPKTGGKIVYGLEAETDGWDPTQNRWAASGVQVALAIMDPLVALDKSFTAQPYLAESLTPSADYKSWTIKLRSGIKFHNGEPLDAAALKTSMDTFRAGPLVGAALKPIESIERVDELTVRIQMSMPWAAFPYILTAQAGVVPAPGMIADRSNAPLRPIGTGPFIFKEWQRDGRLIVTKNPDYWRKGFPYLDEIEFRPLPDALTRYYSLTGGNINVTVSSAEQTIQRMLSDAKEGKLQVTRSTGNNDTNMVLINTSVEPMNDLRVRQAMAYAIDKSVLFSVTGADPSLDADSVFQPDTRWYTPQQGYPKFDLAKAKDLVAQYEKEKGKISFQFNSTTDPDTLKSVQVLAEMWQAAGMNVSVQTYQQADHITNAVTGNFQANIWRQFGAADPDPNYIWWVSENAEGPLTLNMARNKDPQIDAAMREGRATPDVDLRKQAYDKVQARQSADLPYLWLNHLRWSLAADNNVRGLQGMPLPDGGQSAGLVGGVISLTAMWLDT
ncbi:MAG: hypothetical protein HYX32_04580 [Actinobacteria bacterium]|nr:hypothetical protein [Actinomycetota bacterium]